MVETLLDKAAEWLSGTGPNADVVTDCRCRLFRNLADFPFPQQCTMDEKRSIDERLVGVLDSLNLLASGRYWSFTELDERERRFLAERCLASSNLCDSEGPRGVYVADDQSMSISVNDEDHITMCALGSGVQLQNIWSRLSLVDDTLGGALDYAFSERLGYLTSAVARVGTGLEADVTLHLPGLVMRNLIGEVQRMADERRHALQTALPAYNGSALGDLYRLTNRTTLGRSEEETVFHLKHLAAEVVEKERAARKQIIEETPLQVEDRVGRALGLARGARLLEFNEAISVLSSLRLGVSSMLLDTFSLHLINDVSIASQNAHIEMKCGRSCDELTLNAERAELFRARFA